jgi:hypothetical protein
VTKLTAPHIETPQIELVPRNLALAQPTLEDIHG